MSKKSASYDTAEKRTYEDMLKDWNEVEDLVLLYQAQFESGAKEDVKYRADKAMEELLIRFEPLFIKYYTLIKTGRINFANAEVRYFVSSFIESDYLKKELKKGKPKASARLQITEQFYFIRNTYGTQCKEDIYMDLHVVFMTLAKRYKQMGRNFCGYLYNLFRYEVNRLITNFLKNPANIPYRKVEFLEDKNFAFDKDLENVGDDRFYEDNLGIPDMDWIAGITCSETFKALTPLERKIVIKYYLEDWSDRQIANHFGFHINTINKKRHSAISKVSKEMGIPVEAIRRRHKGGDKAVVPTRND